MIRFLAIGMQEIIVIALIVLLLFGGRKIPELMRGLGQGVRSFKEGMKGIEDDVKDIKESINEEINSEEKEGEKE